MGMHDCHIREKHRTVIPVHAARDVYILRIHEKTFVKQSNLVETFHPEKHETALMISDIDRTLILKNMKLP